MGQYRDCDAEKIQQRPWDEIRHEWMNYVPERKSPWPVPDHEVYELPSLELLLNNLGGPKGRDSTVEEEIAGLRTAVLQEAVISIHKAGNALRAAAQEGGSGYRTWSRSTAYHAAFFAMRGVLGLLGVILFSGGDRKKDYQADLWAPRAKGRKPRSTESRFAVRIIRRELGIQHKEMWAVFSRVLRVTKIDPSLWPLLARDPLKTMDPGRFSRVRHQIHYRSAGWLFDDLDSLKNTDDFSPLAEQVASMSTLANPEGDGFPASLALHTLSMGNALMADLGTDIPQLRAEAERAAKWMADAPWKCANAFVLVGTGGGK